MKAILEVRNLVKTYGMLKVLDKIIFFVEAGIRFGILLPMAQAKQPRLK